MVFRLEFSKRAKKELQKLDPGIAKMIFNWLRSNVDGCGDPRAAGKPLKGELRDYWRYRIGDYRVICDIQDDKSVVLAIRAGNRKDVYGKGD